MGIIVIHTHEPGEVTKDELREWENALETAEKAFPTGQVFGFWSHGDEEHDLLQHVESVIEMVTDNGNTHIDPETGEITE